ncbi:ectonucleotide pyrophosphatase/phosphodiesterase family member [Acrasis kona]|uniref:Ectonucleotide pyrophosphatase/phosphodiesterase family member n=1 Tax=Acrasis kona TaxID=1008807 RepID=A0AAW2ZMW5_9EUKA
MIVITGGTKKNTNIQTDSRTNKTVILISIDGFRWDFFEKYSSSCPNMRDRIFNGKNKQNRKGVTTTKMVPVFPSKTFPNHISLVTGVYPEDHGIVSNNMYNPVDKSSFSMSTKDTKWWGMGNAEPIWVTCEKQNVTTATFFWPGSNIKIKGYTPTYFEEDYNGGIKYSARVDKLLSYLSLDKRPHLLLTYFEGVDSAAHTYGPDADQVSAAIKLVDDAIGRLLDGLDERNVDANIVVVSDHGMASMDKQNTVLLSEFYPDIMKYKVVNEGPLMDIFTNDSSVKDVYDGIMRAKNDHNLTQIEVYLKESIPREYHYSDNDLIAPIVIEAKVGWKVLRSSRSYSTKGDHGFNNTAPEMGAFFLANGPLLRNDGSVQRQFDNIHLYSLLAKMLNVTESPTKGSWRSVQYLLN